MTNLLPGIIGIEVPEEDVYDVEINYDGDKIVFWDGAGTIEMDLPAGFWKYLFLSNSATEEDCKGVVERHKIYAGWIDYEHKGQGASLYDEALESFLSLLKSHGLENKNVAILKLIK